MRGGKDVERSREAQKKREVIPGTDKWVARTTGNVRKGVSAGMVRVVSSQKEKDKEKEKENKKENRKKENKKRGRVTMKFHDIGEDGKETSYKRRRISPWDDRDGGRRVDPP